MGICLFKPPYRHPYNPPPPDGDKIIGIAIPLLLLTFYGYTLSGHWSLGKLVIVALVGLWLALGPVYRAGVFPLAYLAAITTTTLTSADVWLSTWSLWGTYTSGLICALALIPYWACIDPRHRPGLETGIRVGAFIMATVGLLQWAGVSWLTPDELFTGRRVYATLGSPIYVGAAAALCYPYCKSQIEKLFLVAVLVASGSRGAWVAVACGTIYLNWPRFTIRARTWGLVAVGAGLIGALWLRPVSDLGRIVTWAAAIDAFKARPWFGWGAGNFLMVAEIWRNPAWLEVYGQTTQDHAHNLFLEAAACSGLLGISGIAGLLYALWTGSDRVTRSALLGVFLVGMLNPLPMVVKALCLALAASCSTEDK